MLSFAMAVALASYGSQIKARRRRNTGRLARSRNAAGAATQKTHAIRQRT